MPWDMAQSCIGWLCGCLETADAEYTAGHSSVDGLVKLCKRTIARSRQRLSDHSLMNKHQCVLLVNKIPEIQDTLAFTLRSFNILDIERATPALQELHGALLSVDRLVQSCCIPSSNSQCWLRLAIDHGVIKMNESFSKLLYDIQWHTIVLQSILVNSPSALFKPGLCDGALNPMDEFALRMAMHEDEKEHLLASSVKLDLGGMNLQLCREAHKLCLLGGKRIDDPLHDHDDSGGGQVAPLQRLGHHHPNVVSGFLCYEPRNNEDDPYFLITEEMDMDLSTFLNLRRVNNDNLSDVKAVALMLQIADGVRFVHSKGLAHRELKVLVTVSTDSASRSRPSRTCSAKVASWTCATHDVVKVGISTQKWVVGEVVGAAGAAQTGELQIHRKADDVYKFAHLCSEILTKEMHPEAELEESEKKVKPKRNLPEGCPRRLASLIRSCWAETCRARPEFSEICQELRYIKGLLLRGDCQELETEFISNAVEHEALLRRCGTGDKEGDQFSHRAPTEGKILQGPWGREEPHKKTGLFDHVANSIKWIRLKYQQSPPGVGFMEVGYVEPDGQELTEAYCANIIGTTWRTIKFEPEEYIKQVCGSVAQHEVSVSDSRGTVGLYCVVSLTIHTNRRSYGPFGDETTGRRFRSGTGKVFGFFGAGGVLLDKLGVWIIPDGQDDGDESFLIEQ